MGAYLLFLDGPKQGIRVPLDPKLVLGKGVFGIDDAAVSSRHCEISFAAGVYSLHDLGSTNGTFVDGRKLEGAHILQANQTLQIGQTRMRFVS